jgi:quinol monooxygenase YgiN
MSVRLFATISAKPGKGDELTRILAANASEVSKEPGCIQFEIYQSGCRPEALILVEHWVDEAALQAHGQITRQRGVPGPELRDGPASVERYEYSGP